MRRFYNLPGILSLSDEEKELIRQQALEGDPVACYKLAEIYLHLHECEDYVSSACELLQKASEGGVADADASLALMMFRGEIEPFDPVAAAKRLEKAINNGSVAGAAFQLRNLLYGRYGYEQNIDLVRSTLEGLLSQGENPYWCTLMGNVLMAEGKIVESQQWYEKAVAGGENSAYADLAMARGINDDFTFRDYEAYNDTLMEGNDAYFMGKCWAYLRVNRNYLSEEVIASHVLKCRKSTLLEYKNLPVLQAVTKDMGYTSYGTFNAYIAKLPSDQTENKAASKLLGKKIYGPCLIQFVSNEGKFQYLPKKYCQTFYKYLQTRLDCPMTYLYKYINL